MKLRLCLLLLCCAVPACALAAEGGRYTIVDGDARVLRGTTWYGLLAGAAVEEGDVLDLGSGAVVQVELTRGAIVNAAGPAALYAASLPANGPAEWVFAHGWAKARAQAQPLRLRSALLELDVTQGTVVAHLDPDNAGAFVEQGNVKVWLPASRGKPVAAGDLRDSDFVSRVAQRPPAFGDRAPLVFVTAMPRYMRDALPALAKRFAGRPPALRAGREVNLAEADTWLGSVARATFARRFAPRLKDPDFRAAVGAHAAAYPEWAHAVRLEPPASTDDNASADERRREQP
jgi:hypothetical protein